MRNFNRLVVRNFPSVAGLLLLGACASPARHPAAVAKAAFTCRVEEEKVFCVREGEAPQHVANLEILKEERVVYHWGSKRKIDVWQRAGGVPADEFEERVTKGEGAFACGGLYVSASPSDSSDYGDHVMAFELPAGSRIGLYTLAGWDYVPDQGPPHPCPLNRLNVELRKLDIVAIRKKPDETWHNVISSRISARGYVPTAAQLRQALESDESRNEDGRRTVEERIRAGTFGN